MNAVDTNVWQPLDVAPIPSLADLRADVLKRSEKRLPKWKFRLARDLVIQVQPRPGPRYLFECVAVMSDGANAAALSSPRCLDREWWLMRCHIDTGETTWQLKPKGYSRPHGTAWNGHYQHLRSQIFAAFDGDDNRFAELTPDLMLGPHCLICGRALTDPASMARFIGPECGGTSSITMRRMLCLAAGAEPSTGAPGVAGQR